MVYCTGLENRRTERYRGFESLSLRKKKEAKASFFALEGMRTPEWGFVIDEVACQSKNPSLSAAKGVNQVVMRFAPFFTPTNQGWVYFF